MGRLFALVAPIGGNPAGAPQATNPDAVLVSGISGQSADFLKVACQPRSASRTRASAGSPGALPPTLRDHERLAGHRVDALVFSPLRPLLGRPGSAPVPQPRLLLLDEPSPGLAHRGYVLRNGAMTPQGTATSLRQSELVMKSYLGTGPGSPAPRGPACRELRVPQDATPGSSGRPPSCRRPSTRCGPIAAPTVRSR